MMTEILLAVGIAALVCAILVSSRESGRRVAVEINPPLRDPCIQVVSIDYSDDDVLIFEQPAAGGHDMKLLLDFLNNSIIGQFPENIDRKSRRRTVFVPHGMLSRVFHVRRKGAGNEGPAQ